MKRVKMMLVAITMIAAVGGTLAFKASKLPGQRAFTCNTNLQVCQSLPIARATTTVDIPQASTVTTSYTLTVANIQGADCNNATAPCTVQPQPSTFIIGEQ